MAAKKAPAKKKAAAKKTSTTSEAAAKKAPAKQKAVAKKTPTKNKAAAKRAPAKKAPAKKRAAAKKEPAKAPTKRTGTRSSGTAAGKQTATKQSPGKKSPTKKSPTKKSPSKKSTATGTSSGRRSAATEERSPAVQELPKPRFNKDGFGYTKDFDLSFVKEMYESLQEERVMLTGQAKRLEDEAHQLVEEAEMGDVQFDDEGGEGDTMVVERERDLALSAQARDAVVEIDAAIDRIMSGTYGYSVLSGRPIPRERLEAIPWSAELVEEKVGGIGRR